MGQVPNGLLLWWGVSVRLRKFVVGRHLAPGDAMREYTGAGAVVQ